MGVILNSLLISALTSSISVKVIEEVVNPTPGKTVGVLKGSPGDFYANVKKKVSGTSKKELHCLTVMKENMSPKRISRKGTFIRRKIEISKFLTLC